MVAQRYTRKTIKRSVPRTADHGTIRNRAIIGVRSRRIVTRAGRSVYSRRRRV